MSKIALTGHKRFVLLDANLVAGYYLPDSLSWKPARPRIQNIVDAVRKGGAPEVFLFIPTLCIVEVFAVFSRYSFAKWDTQVKKNMPRGLDTRAYKRIRTKFSSDLHNGHVLQQVEFNRYHVLATDLISPVDAHFQHYRNRAAKRKGKTSVKRHKRMMSATDHAIIGMGIQLSKIHGRDNFAILTADHRFADILTRATSVKKATAERLGLVKTSKDLGLKYGPDIYPQVINLAKAKDKELEGFFGDWLLPTKTADETPGEGVAKERRGVTCQAPASEWDRARQPPVHTRFRFDLRGVRATNGARSRSSRGLVGHRTRREEPREERDEETVMHARCRPQDERIRIPRPDAEGNFLPLPEWFPGEPQTADTQPRIRRIREEVTSK